MSVLQKLKDIKRVLDRNLNTRSWDILPVINECIKELEESKQIVITTPVTTVDKKHITKEDLITPNQVKVEVKTTAENTIEPTKDINKEVKQFLKDQWVSNRKFLNWDKAKEKAKELGFII